MTCIAKVRELKIIKTTREETSQHAFSKFTLLLCCDKTKQHYTNGSVVIGAKLVREDHDSIPCNCDRKGAETT
jgi:hypothetical protein